MQVLEHVQKWIQNRDEQSYPIIIQHYIPLVKILSRKYIRNCPNKRDDIMGVGFLGLVNAVFKAPDTMKDFNIASYIAACINGAIKNFLAHDTVVHIPRTANVQAKFVQIPESIEVGNHSIVAKLQFEDLWELFDFTSTEARIIKMRLEGYTFAEISESLCMSQTTIKRMVKALKEKRFEARILDASA